jgi:hypothetical protein
MVRNDSSGWIEIKPTNPDSARTFRVDRSAAAKLVRASLSKGSPTLDDIAEYSQFAPPPSTDGVSQLYLMMFAPAAMMPTMTGQTSWELYRLFGQLSPDRRQALASGSKLPLNSLSGGQQTSLVSLVFGARAQIQTGTGPAKEQSYFEQMMSMNTGGQDYKSESTELLPNGVPGGGYLEMKTEEQPCFSIHLPGAEAGGFSMTIGLDELAMFKFFTEQSAFKSAPEMGTMFEKMAMGARTAYHLTFHLADGVRVVGTLNDDRIGKNATTVSLKSLPDDIMALVDKKMEVYKKLGMNMNPQTGLGGTPPPP